MKYVFYFFILILCIQICKFSEVSMETKSESKTELKSEIQNKLKTEAKTELLSGIKTEAKSRSEVKAETICQSKTEAKTELKSEMKTKEKTKLESQYKSEAKTELKSQSKTEVKIKTESSSELNSFYSKSNENCPQTCISCQNTLYFLKIHGHVECTFNMCPGLCSVLSSRWYSNTNEILNYFKEDQINICETCFRNNFCHINDCQMEKTISQTAIHHAIENFNFHVLNPNNQIFNFLNKKSQDYFIEMDFIFRNLDKMIDQLNLFERLYTESIKMKKIYKILLKFLANKSSLPLSDINLHLDIDIDEGNLMQHWKDIPNNLQIYKNYYVTLKSHNVHLDETKVYLSTDIKSEQVRIKSIEDFDMKMKFSLEKVGNMTEIYKLKTEKNLFALHLLVKFLDVVAAENLSNEEKLDYLTGKLKLDDAGFIKFLKQPKKTKAEKVLTNLNKMNQSIMSISVNGKVIQIPPEVPVLKPKQDEDQININVVEEDIEKKNKNKFFQKNLKEFSLSNENSVDDSGIRTTATTKNLNSKLLNNISKSQKVNPNVLGNVKDISVKNDGGVVENKLSPKQVKKMKEKMQKGLKTKSIQKEDGEIVESSIAVKPPSDPVDPKPPIEVVDSQPSPDVKPPQPSQEEAEIPTSKEPEISAGDGENSKKKEEYDDSNKPSPDDSSASNSTKEENTSLETSSDRQSKNKENDSNIDSVNNSTESEKSSDDSKNLLDKNPEEDSSKKKSTEEIENATPSKVSESPGVTDESSEKKSENSDSSSENNNNPQSNSSTDTQNNSSEANFENLKDLFFIEKSDEEIKNFLQINKEPFKLSDSSKDEDIDSYFKYDDTNDKISKMKKSSEIMEKNKIKKLSLDEIKESSKKFIDTIKQNFEDIETEKEIKSKLRKEKFKSNILARSISKSKPKHNSGEQINDDSLNNNFPSTKSNSSSNIIQSFSNNLKTLDEEFFELKHNIITNLIK